MGRAVALSLSSLGARLLLVSGSEGPLKKVADDVAEQGGEAVTLASRINSESDAEALMTAGIAALGGVDSIFYGAGYNKPAMIEDQSLEDWEAIMDANVRGPWLTARAFGRHVSDRGGRGRIVLVSSVRGRHGNAAGYTAYCTSKGAIDALTKTLATEWGSRGINVNAIAPAVFRSALTDWIFQDTEAGRDSRQRNMARIPLKRMGEPEDFVGAALYLLSPASDFVTGQILYVDGGYTAA
jgi:NAD(P)-dependent dehydrogenase (short-subunit alcohol dehydrogenase family)